MPGARRAGGTTGRADVGPAATAAGAATLPEWTDDGGGFAVAVDRDADMPAPPVVKRCMICGRGFYCRFVPPLCLTCRMAPPAVRPAPIDPAIRNRPRRPLPAGARRARERYRAAGLCAMCGGERDRPDRKRCESCRRRQADAQNRHRAAHPPDRDRLRADVRARRRRYLAAGRCPECGAERDRPDRKLCARCRRRAAAKQRAHRRATGS